MTAAYFLPADFDNVNVTAAEFVIPNKGKSTSLCFLSADEGLNVSLHAHLPKDDSSWGGIKLVPL